MVDLNVCAAFGERQQRVASKKKRRPSKSTMRLLENRYALLRTRNRIPCNGLANRSGAWWPLEIFPGYRAFSELFHCPTPSEFQMSTTLPSTSVSDSGEPSHGESTIVYEKL